ncbi:putative paraquat-inducible protein B [Sphaerochaeta pleomorpha str. Grapes]|uniref:Trans-2-enoyl-CoA reductase [NADH] n=1 Tax=Sphaerochaeta pleomorpha (strain ATCC BAA-1885 / DSM 22778 / Grapes) TaxID=158190 RepID=G8QV68_SPHPG|nr:enoyl-ACP reductase FabV [Sphaerochaeta pleomorpha]AEV29304.1 putative paraquat-inducible protein B [Sphaerochaeta pleomorpha str. Grapes]
MIITKKVLRNVSLTAHPQGCAQYVQDQIDWVQAHAHASLDSRYQKCDDLKLPRRILVLGGSTGYGLSSRIVGAFGSGSDTINVSFEREPSQTKTATPGWYNTMAFEKRAKEAGLKAESIFGDAFSDETKQKTGALIKSLFGQVDLVIYSLASPLRTDPKTGTTYRSVLKPLGKPFSALSVDMDCDVVKMATIEPAEGTQAEETVHVMGGEDWALWIEYLMQENLLAEGAMTVSYSYIGPKITYPVYREGTIGKAKEDLEKTAAELTKKLQQIQGKAYVSVNKALVTRASAVIPVVPLYMAILYQVMKERDLHEHCTEQIYRLFTEKLFSGKQIPTDDEGRVRVDDWEMQDDIQAEVERRWALQKEGEPLKDADIEGVRKEYDQIHGFGFDSIDYEKDVDPRDIY